MKQLDKKLPVLGCLIALDIIATRFLGFSTLTIRISFGSMFIILAGMWFGSVEGAMVGGIADVLGCLIAGAGFNPLLTVSPVLAGMLIGLWRPWVKQKGTLFAYALAVACTYFVTTMCVATAILSLMYGTPFVPLFISRISQYAVNTSVNIGLSYAVYRSAVTRIAKAAI